MTSRLRWVGWLVLGCAAVLDGCTKGQEAAGEVGEITAAERSVIEAECDFLASCAAEAMGLFSGGSRESCVARGVALYNRTTEVARLRDAGACGQWIRAQGCELPLLWSRLGMPFSPMFHAGTGPLILREDRALPAACGLVSQEGATALFTRRESALDEPCNFEGMAACRPDLACVLDLPLRTDQGTICGRCAVPAAIGAACQRSRDCSAGAWCQQGVCVAELAAGSPCERRDVCAAGPCQDGRCLSQQEQQEQALATSKLGASCNGSLGCGQVLTCQAGVCVERVELGQACSGNACRLDLVCADGVCQRPVADPKLNEPCEQAPRSCASDQLCDLERHVCVRAPAAGEACSGPCAAEFDCRAGGQTPDSATVCQPLRARGEPCDSSSECATGWCSSDRSGCTLEGDNVACSVPAPVGTCTDWPGPEACGVPL
jgi:hypothetical protein